MKSVDSLNSSLIKRKSGSKNSGHAAGKKRINSGRHKKQAGAPNKVLIFWALVVFSTGLIFISWLFFLKVELKDVARGGTFSKVIFPLGQAIANTQEDLAKIKNINFEKMFLPEADTKNQNKEEISPEIKELEEQVFPQFEE